MNAIVRKLAAKRMVPKFSRGLLLSSFPHLTSDDVGEYSMRRADTMYQDWEEIFDFQFKNLNKNETPESELYKEEKEKFYWRLGEGRGKFTLLVAMKNTPRFMREKEEYNEKNHYVSMQRSSFFTPETMRRLGIANKSFVTPETERVLGTVNLYYQQNVLDRFGFTPKDPMWIGDRLNHAYMELLVGEAVRRNYVGTELFRYAKGGLNLLGVEKLFMEANDEPGLKFAAKVGCKVIPTVHKGKILLGQKLGFR